MLAGERLKYHLAEASGVEASRSPPGRSPWVGRRVAAEGVHLPVMAPKKKGWDFGAQSEITAELGVEAASRLANQYKNAKRDKLKSDLAAGLTAWLMGTKKNVVWDEATAAKKWEDDRGNATSTRLLGVAYERGRGKELNLEKARRCFLKAAMMGDVTAQRYVAGCYFRGVGGDVNYDEAFRWYTKAYEAGDIKAQACLGDMLDAGLGCDRDPDEARTYYRACHAKKSLASKSSY